MAKDKVGFNFELYPDEAETLVEDIVSSRIRSLEKRIKDTTSPRETKQLEAELKTVLRIKIKMNSGRTVQI